MTTLKELRTAAQNGCVTCGTLYAGVKLPGTATSAVTNEEDQLVNIGRDGHVASKPRDFSVDSIGIEYEFYTTRAAASCRAFKVLKEFPPDTGSPASLRMVSKWIEECKTHEQCRRPPNPPMPTRVIDVVGRNNDPVLIESNGLRAEYATLSHCWGQQLFTTTTKDTIDQRKRRIPLDLLPWTFRDAIYIADLLGYRYLWIDALCIIQDDQNDWQRESASMAAVYENSALTLAASAAEHSMCGLFARTDRLGGACSWEVTCQIRGDEHENVDLIGSKMGEFTTENHFPLNTLADSYQGGRILAQFPDPDAGVIALRYFPRFSKASQSSATDNEDSANRRLPAPFQSIFGSDIFVRRVIDHREFGRMLGNNYRSPLSTRAWVYQERLLSSRILHFTESELVWECQSVSKCQCNLILRQGDAYVRVSSEPGAGEKNTLMPSFHKRLKVKLGTRAILEFWKDTVHHYTALNLTHEADRLPALSGLAHKFSLLGLGAYHAGMWEDHMDQLLLWEVAPWDNGHNRPRKSTAPTWSWASVKGNVAFMSNFSPADPATASLSESILGRVLQVECQTIGLDDMGEVAGGKIVVMAQTITAKLRTKIINRGNLMFWNYELRIYNDLDGTHALFRPDSMSDFDLLSDEQDVVCALWASPPLRTTVRTPSSELETYILVLRLARGSSDTYQRLGLLRNINASFPTQERVDVKQWFLDSHEQQLTII